MSADGESKRWPVLADLAGPELDEMERVLRRGREGRHRGEPSLSKGHDFNFNKADSHMGKMGPECRGLDADDTGAPHGLLAAIRLIFVQVCIRKGQQSR